MVVALRKCNRALSSDNGNGNDKMSAVSLASWIHTFGAENARYLKDNCVYPRWTWYTWLAYVYVHGNQHRDAMSSLDFWLGCLWKVEWWRRNILKYIQVTKICALNDLESQWWYSREAQPLPKEWPERCDTGRDNGISSWDSRPVWTVPRLSYPSPLKISLSWMPSSAIDELGSFSQPPLK